MQDIRPPSPLWWPYTRCPIRIILSLSFLSVSLRWPTRLRDLSLPPHVPHVPHLPHVHRCRSSLWTLGTGTVSCRAFRWRGFLGVEPPLKTCVYTIVYIYMCVYIYNHIHMKHSETTNWSRVLIPGSLDVVCWWTSAWPARHLPSAKAHLEGDWGCMWSVTTSAFAAAASRGSSGTARWSWCL